MKKQTIRLNESQLHRLIKESVKNVLSEKSWQNSPMYKNILKDKTGLTNSEIRKKEIEKSEREEYFGYTYEELCEKFVLYMNNHYDELMKYHHDDIEDTVLGFAYDFLINIRNRRISETEMNRMAYELTSTYMKNLI